MPSNSSKRTGKTRAGKQTGTKRHLIHPTFLEFIEAVPDAVVVVNRRGGIDLVNGQTEKMFGYKRKDLLGKSVETLLPVRFRNMHAQHLSRYFAESPRARPMGIGLDLAGRHRDGREFPVDISLTPQQTPQGVVTIAVVRDVTERKLVSERRYEELVGSLKAIIWEADAETGRFTFVSRYAQELLGYPVEQWLAEPTFWQDHLHPDDRNRVVEEWRRAVADLRTREREYRMVASNDRVVWMRDTLTVIAESGRAVKLCGIMRDISETKSLEKELALQEESLKSFFTAAPAGLAIVDADLRFLQTNDTLAQMHGLPAEEHLGKTVREVLPKLAPVLEPVLRRVIATGKPDLNFETSGETPAQPGVLRHWVASYFPLYGGRGKPDCVGVIVVEFTRQKQSEATIRSLLDISRKLNSTLDVDALMDALVVEAIKLIDAEGGFAGLRTAQGMVCHKYFQGSKAVPLEYCFPPGHGLPGWVAIHKVSYLTNDAAPDTQFVPEMRERLGVRSAISTPILDTRGEVIGFFEIINKKGGSGFTPSDLEKLMAVSGAASVAVQNALAYRKIQLEEKALAELSGSLLHLRDEEQRRIGRELHDTAGQTLVALKMNLGRVNKPSDLLDAGAREALSESLALTDQCIREIRTLSHLLHPPLLDEAGLSSALTWFARGFAERSGIRVALDLPPDLGRLPQELEITLFRIVQECLTNIHRHSGSPTAKIRMVRNPSTLLLDVEDEGRGMPPEVIQGATEISAAVGVGIAGMRERLHQLGGRLEIHSGSRGAQVRAILPLGGGAA